MKEITERIIELKKTYDIIKQISYDLSIKYYDYCINNNITQVYYNLKNKKIDELNFTIDNLFFGDILIGYSEVHWGDTSEYNNYFTFDEIIDENIIKNRLDKIIKETREKEEKEEKRQKIIYEDKKKKLEKEEKELFLKLKEKYEKDI